MNIITGTVVCKQSCHKNNEGFIFDRDLNLGLA